MAEVKLQQSLCRLLRGREFKDQLHQE